MPNLVLYYRKYCMFCIKVLDFLKNQNIQIHLKDIANDKNANKELLSRGGKTQVPCLFIDNKPLFESLDIIDYLKKNIQKF